MTRKCKPMVYISGEITGVSRDVYLARFNVAASLIHKAGYKPVNPCKFLPCRWPWLYKLLGYKLTLLYDLWRLSRCDMIYKIPGWRSSKGASIESCWAYHQKIWVLPYITRETIDKKMAKYIDKQETKLKEAAIINECKEQE